MINLDRYVIYTDGACKGNPGEGASAYVILDSKEQNKIESNSFYYSSCTNNYAELMAIFEALEFIDKKILLDENTVIIIKSDSKYCVDGCNKWMYNWNKKGTLSNRPNGDIWKNLYFLIQIIKRQIYNLEFIHIKGHSGVEWNEYCDELVNKTINEYHGVELVEAPSLH
jgi:ribonuclease HI